MKSVAECNSAELMSYCGRYKYYFIRIHWNIHISKIDSDVMMLFQVFLGVILALQVSTIVFSYLIIIFAELNKYILSVALCEFHHQDHKLSFNTSKHAIKTFKEIAYFNHNAQSRGDPSPVHLEFKFPPVPCPEALISDCSLYCHTCLHLISAQAMIDHHHQTHHLENYLECVGKVGKFSYEVFIIIIIIIITLHGR